MIAYSEALPTQLRSNITVLMAERKEMERSTGIWRRVTGSPFQVAGPATEEARRCLVAVLERGTLSSACMAERRQRRSWTCVLEQQSSRKYGGARPSMQHLSTLIIICVVLPRVEGFLSLSAKTVETQNNTTSGQSGLIHHRNSGCRN